MVCDTLKSHLPARRLVQLTPAETQPTPYEAVLLATAVVVASLGVSYRQSPSVNKSGNQKGNGLVDSWKHQLRGVGARSCRQRWRLAWLAQGAEESQHIGTAVLIAPAAEQADHHNRFVAVIRRDFQVSKRARLNALGILLGWRNLARTLKPYT